MPEFELTASPSPEELAVITDALLAFNNADVGPSDRRPLAVLIRDTDGKVTGGLSGFTAWGWLFTQMLYIPDTLRGTGIERREPGGAAAPGSTHSARRPCASICVRVMRFSESLRISRKAARAASSGKESSGLWQDHSRQAIVPFSRSCTPSAIGTTSTRPGSTGPGNDSAL